MQLSGVSLPRHAPLASGRHAATAGFVAQTHTVGRLVVVNTVARAPYVQLTLCRSLVHTQTQATLTTIYASTHAQADTPPATSATSMIQMGTVTNVEYAIQSTDPVVMCAALPAGWCPGALRACLHQQNIQTTPDRPLSAHYTNLHFRELTILIQFSSNPYEPDVCYTSKWLTQWPCVQHCPQRGALRACLHQRALTRIPDVQQLLAWGSANQACRQRRHQHYL
jgi:hypothetical protein